MNLNLDSVKSNTALELVSGLESGDLDWQCDNNNNNDRLTAFDPGQPG